MTRATHEIRREAKEVDMRTVVFSAKSLLHFIKEGCCTKFNNKFVEKGRTIEKMEEKSSSYISKETIFDLMIENKKLNKSVAKLKRDHEEVSTKLRQAQKDNNDDALVKGEEDRVN